MMGRARSRLKGLLALLFAAGAVQLMRWTGVDDQAETVFVAATIATIVVIAFT